MTNKKDKKVVVGGQGCGEEEEWRCSSGRIQNLAENHGLTDTFLKINNHQNFTI